MICERPLPGHLPRREKSLRLVITGTDLADTRQMITSTADPQDLQDPRDPLGLACPA